MSPRAPLTTITATAVAFTLFGLMETMVREPSAYQPPSLEPLGEFIAPDPAELLTPRSIERKAPEQPHTAQRPSGEAQGALTTEENLRPEAKGPALVFSSTPPNFKSNNLILGPVAGPGEVGGCGGGEPLAKFLITPDYPRERRAAGVEGSVEVEFVVAADGSVTEAHVLSSTPRGAFDAATLRAVKRWKFEPATADCPRNAVRMQETVNFRLEGVED